MSVVILNDLAYNSPEEDPLVALGDCIAFSVEDWGASRSMAWVYGIVLGWDDEDEDESALAELAERFGWDAFAVERLRRLHAAFVALGAKP